MPSHACSLPSHTRRLPTQYSNYMPSDTVVDMLLHIKNEELASPLPDTVHPTINKLEGTSTEAVVSLVSDDK